MNDTNVEGTITLNGLVEGPLPDDPAYRDWLQQWVRDVAKLGLDFQLEVAGNNYSLLPGNEPRSCAALGDLPHEAICQALEQLINPLPPDVAARVTSTLRSSEYRKGEEVQAVYLVRADGKPHVEQRTVDADTVPPPEPIHLRQLIRPLLVGVVVLAALFGITSLFVDVPGLARQLIDTIRPVRVAEVDIDNTSYDPFFHAEATEVSSKALKITLQRTEAFPTDDPSLQEAADAAEGEIKRWLAVAAIARGYVKCDLFDADSKYVGSATLRIDALRDGPTMNVEVPLNQRSRFRLGKIVFVL